MISGDNRMRKLHRMKLHTEPFNAIASGAKTIELRLYDEKRRRMGVGDLIEFCQIDGVGEVIVCKVVALHVYASFEELYRALPLEKCGYTADEVAGSLARASDMRAYYSAQDEARFGVVGIELTKCEHAEI